MSLEVRTGLSITAFARRRSAASIHRLDGQEQVGEDDRGIDIQNLRRCSVICAARSGRLQISRMPCLARMSRYCYVAASLPHKPKRIRRGRPKPKKIQFHKTDVLTLFKDV